MSSPGAAVSVRPMTAADVEWAMELADTVPEAPHWPLAAYTRAVNPQGAPPRIALVAELPMPDREENAGGSRAGFAVASLVPPQAELETIVVAAAERRAGIGRALMAALAARLRAAGITEVILEVRASNAVAQACYRSLGFQTAGRRPGYYVDPIEDAIFLRHQLF